MSGLGVEALSKTFHTPEGPVPALQAVSAQLPAGQIVGLLGPNGSGKTTFLRIITGILAPDEGQLRWEGKPLTRALQRRFGYMPEERGLYPHMPAAEQLLYLLRLRGLSKAAAQQAIHHWAARIEAPWLHRPARTLSKGMQQKVQLILALAGEPLALLLDEPFSGLDPLVASEIEALLQAEARTGRLVLVSTHRLEQVDHLCDYVLLIHQGKVRLEGAVADLRRRFWDFRYEIETAVPLAELTWPTEVTVTPLTPYRAQLTLSPTYSARHLLETLLPQTEIRSFTERLPTMREIFLKVTDQP